MVIAAKKLPRLKRTPYGLVSDTQTDLFLGKPNNAISVRRFRNSLISVRRCSHLVPEHRHKWCCVHTLGTRYISAQFSARILAWVIKERCVHISAHQESFTGTVLGHQVWTQPNSHYLSQVAVLFIDAWAKRSTVKNCLFQPFDERKRWAILITASFHMVATIAIDFKMPRPGIICLD